MGSVKEQILREIYKKKPHPFSDMMDLALNPEVRGKYRRSTRYRPTTGKVKGMDIHGPVLKQKPENYGAKGVYNALVSKFGTGPGGEKKYYKEQRLPSTPPTVSPTTFSGLSKGASRLKRVDPQALTQKGPLRPSGSHVSSPAVGKYKDTMDAWRQGGRTQRYAVWGPSPTRPGVIDRSQPKGRREFVPGKYSWKDGKMVRGEDSTRVKPHLDVSRSRTPSRTRGSSRWIRSGASYVRDKGETGKLALGPGAYRTGHYVDRSMMTSARNATLVGKKLQQKRATSQEFINKVRASQDRQTARTPASRSDIPRLRQRSQELGYKTLSRRRKED